MINNIVEYLNSNHLFLVGASVASILGFLLSLILLIFTTNIRRKLLWFSEVKSFNSNREYLCSRLTGLKDLIAKNKILDDKLISDLNTEIRIYQNFKHINSLEEKIKILLILRHLNKKKNQTNKTKLCNQIAYFIGKYSNPKEELIQ